MKNDDAFQEVRDTFFVVVVGVTWTTRGKSVVFFFSEDTVSFWK